MSVPEVCVHVVSEDKVFLQFKDTVWELLAFWPGSSSYIIKDKPPISYKELLKIVY